MTDFIVWARVGPNTNGGRDFVVGDIHGEFDKVDELLLKVKFDEEKDRLFATGDLIDRGDQNEDALKWLAQPWFYSCLGNHEQMLIYACSAADDDVRQRFARMHYGNGGQWFYSLDQAKQQELYDAFSQLPIAMEIETEVGLVGIIHADVPSFDWKDVKKSLMDKDSNANNTALWGRERISRKITKEILGITKVFVGHSPVKYSLMLGNVHYVDTGACFKDGHMTMIEICTGEVFIVK